MVGTGAEIKRALKGLINPTYDFFFADGLADMIEQCTGQPGAVCTIMDALKDAYMYGYYNGHKATLNNDYMERSQFDYEEEI